MCPAVALHGAQSRFPPKRAFTLCRRGRPVVACGCCYGPLNCWHSPSANREQDTDQTRLAVPNAKSNPQLVLRPQDLLVLLRLSLEGATAEAPSYAALAADLGLTASEVHAAVTRAVAAQLAMKDPTGRPRVRLEPLRLFVQHGARYCFPATRGPQTRGVPTSYAAAPLNALIRSTANEPPPVWPDKNGTVRGETLHPLYPTVPQAALRSQPLYELLAVFDAIRSGSARERALAVKWLDERWSDAGAGLAVA